MSSRHLARALVHLEVTMAKPARREVEFAMHCLGKEAPMEEVVAMVEKFGDIEWQMVREMLKDHDEWVAKQKPIIIDTSRF